uniref:Uncharacterized protein n=1 Tax=Chelonoidis abingdonii TaxID=106734 RepID=A0A8C0HFI6_CHEAB
MGFAEDKVYEYIRENMSDFHHTRVLQLIRHLPCLSDADRVMLYLFFNSVFFEPALTLPQPVFCVLFTVKS